MAYFDSPKNRAFWEREMVSLRAERERRAQNGFVPEEKKVEKKEANPFRKRINLAELEKQEMEAQGIKRVRRPVRAKENTMDKAKDMEMKGRSL